MAQRIWGPVWMACIPKRQRVRELEEMVSQSSTT